MWTQQIRNPKLFVCLKSFHIFSWATWSSWHIRTDPGVKRAVFCAPRSPACVDMQIVDLPGFRDFAARRCERKDGGFALVSLRLIIINIYYKPTPVDFGHIWGYITLCHRKKKMCHDAFFPMGAWRSVSINCGCFGCSDERSRQRKDYIWKFCSNPGIGPVQTRALH